MAAKVKRRKRRVTIPVESLVGETFNFVFESPDGATVQCEAFVKSFEPRIGLRNGGLRVVATGRNFEITRPIRVEDLRG